MTAPQDTLTTELELALAYTPADLRPQLRTALALDQRLSRIVAATTEPMLGQMRLAWWRDMLAAPVPDRPSGDAVLDQIAAHWDGREGALSDMVDGWEILIVADTLGQDQLTEYARQRSAPFTVMVPPEDRTGRSRVEMAGMVWALADTASRITDDAERDAVLQCAASFDSPSGKLTKRVRGLAVLEALAVRALSRGGRPLMEGRGASITALRAGMLGR